jgi:hypothetical protein
MQAPMTITATGANKVYNSVCCLSCQWTKLTFSQLIDESNFLGYTTDEDENDKDENDKDENDEDENDEDEDENDGDEND